MLEIKDGKKILTTPVSAEDLKDIHAGDIIYLNGSMTTCRDVAHRRLVEEGRELIRARRENTPTIAARVRAGHAPPATFP